MQIFPLKVTKIQLADNPKWLHNNPSIMKLFLPVFIILLIPLIIVHAQSPNLMSYQAVIWDAGGNLVADKEVNIRLSILQGVLSGPAVFVETHRVRTNANGLASLLIGGGTTVSGKLSEVKWGEYSFFLKTETDPSGGNNFTISGTTQLVSVPYALYSGISGNILTPERGLPGQVLTINKEGKPSWIATLPAISTNAPGDIAPNSAKSGGNISSDGGAQITARGIVWSTSPNPTISLSTKTTDGSGTGSFSSTLTGLTSNTLYYVRAYATNSVGTAYGNEVSFTTVANLPVLTTNSVRDVTSTTATSGGNITSDGGSGVTARGVVWNTSTNPTISLPTKTSNGSGIGAFNAGITGLAPNITYYVRAYATNSAGTGYGNEVTFTTSNNCAGVSTVKDTSGNVYNTVQIGSQCWMKENLKTTKYRNGDSIPNVLIERFKVTSGAWSYYDDDSYNNTDYGKLYNWYAAIDPRGICPEGWHVPTADEWQVLRNFVGETPGSKLKDPNYFAFNWADPNPTNQYNFSARAAGYQYDYWFSSLKLEAFFWTSSPYENNTAFARTLKNNTPEFPSTILGRANQMSIRCVKD
jgi:uncharacterized protein (TIGR02145 family)